VHDLASTLSPSLENGLVVMIVTCGAQDHQVIYGAVEIIMVNVMDIALSASPFKFLSAMIANGVRDKSLHVFAIRTFSVLVVPMLIVMCCRNAFIPRNLPLLELRSLVPSLSFIRNGQPGGRSALNGIASATSRTKLALALLDLIGPYVERFTALLANTVNHNHQCSTA
jgi:hypothetical protein